MKLSKFAFMFFMFIPVGVSAQSAAEADFLSKNEELTNLFRHARKTDDYKACEDILRKQIALFCSMDSLLSEPFGYFKHKSYYDLACIQSIEGKKDEAIRSFVEAYDDGNFELTYKSVMEDKDLDNIRNEKGFQTILAKIKEASDYIKILRNAPAYSETTDASGLPVITYLDKDDKDLVRVREYFKLDSVAGNCDELTKIRKILTYIHDKIRHDGTQANPRGDRNAINYGSACKDGAHSLNCRGMATVLNECYLAMGIKSRIITCLPKRFFSDCHVINAVYSETLGKWLWIDPTNNAWVTDDKGNMLSVPEVRERLRAGLPVQVNDEANWNNERKVETEDYLYSYMAKNLFYIECWTRYGFNTESDKNIPVNYIMLQPPGCKSNAMLEGSIAVNDDSCFWAAPGA